MNKYLTRQEIFDKVSKHLLTQNKKAKDDTTCRYLTPDGLKCAIGCLIEVGYDERIEGLGLPDSYMKRGLGYMDIFIGILKKNKIASHDLGFLQDLQQVHDNCEVEDWKYELKAMADSYDLKYLELG